jgi:FixJ family two-component response regulator
MAEKTHGVGDVFIVDDDPVICTMLSILFSREGYQPTCFSDGSSLLAATRARTPACIVLDVHIPGRSGLDILKELNAQNYPAPIFIMSGHGDIPMAVDAIRHGAFDFVEKPFRGSELVARVREAIDALSRRGVNDKASATPAFRLPADREPLTSRESEVLAQFVAGASNKEAGRQLGISPRTIEVHRARIMEKLGAKNIADVIRIVMSGKPAT